MNWAVAALLTVLSTVPSQPMLAAETKSILVFGDSLSDGFMLKRSEAYPALVAKKLHDAALNLADGIHPNAAGQKILAENLWRVLEPIAREVAASTHAPESQ